jgi:hypothetical protein
MWKKWIGAAALVAVGWMAFAQTSTEPAPAGATSGTQTVRKVVYVVQPNDTLWDISGRFLNSPYYWPKIWERNSFIIDPKKIFPGDVINLYPESEKLTPPPVETVPKMGEEKPVVMPSGTVVPQAGSTAQPEAKVVRDEYGRAIKVIYKEAPATGWIEPGEFERAGKIVRVAGDRLEIAAYDHVWVNLGSAKGMKVGDIFSVFRVDQQINNPATNKKIGYKILNLGQIKIVNMNEKAAEAEISVSYYDMQVGDYIRPYVPPLSAEIPVIASAANLSGYIIASRRDTPNFGQNDVVYIDLGKNKGVAVGNAFEVYDPGEAVQEESQGMKGIKGIKGWKGIKGNGNNLMLPDTVVGTLVVLDVRDNTSVCLVTESSHEFQVGYKVRTASSNPAQ